MVVAHRPRCARMGSAGHAGARRPLRPGAPARSTCSAICPRDLRIGRCYLPASELAALGLVPQDLLTPASLPRVRPLLDALIDEALRRLDEGRAYTLAVPRREARLRLASLWPLADRARHARPAPAGREPARPCRHGQGVSRRGTAAPRSARSPSCGPTAGSAPGPGGSPPPPAALRWDRNRGRPSRGSAVLCSGRPRAAEACPHQRSRSRTQVCPMASYDPPCARQMSVTFRGGCWGG